MNILSKLFVGATFMLGAASAHAGWQQTFNDDFDGTSLNTSTWRSTDYWGLETDLSGDRQCYKDSSISVNGGDVSLTATNEVPSGCNPDPGNLLYTSGQITSAVSFRQAYGYFEIRAKVAKGKGLLSQFKLAIPGGSFPPQPPQIYALEVNGADTTHVVQRYDYLDNNGLVTGDAHAQTGDIDYSADFHTYGIDWQPGLIIFYIDGVEAYRHAGADVYSQSMYLIADLSVGNPAAGDPDGSTVFPSAMQIDYIRAYQRVNDGTSDDLPPTVEPPAPPADTRAPSVQLTQPDSRIKLVGGATITFAATATDDVGVTDVSFYVDGLKICTDKTAPYACSFKLPKLPLLYRLFRIPLPVLINAVARDAAGNKSIDSKIVLISN
jgi:beta-glucanase (GH16 family)